MACPGTFVALQKCMFTETLRQVRIYDSLSEPFPIDPGVRRGSILAPFLFNLVDSVCENVLQDQKLGVTLDDMVITDFAFGDDICLTEDNPEDAQKLLNCFTNSAAKHGLQINALKTKFRSSFSSDDIECLGEPLE